MAEVRNPPVVVGKGKRCVCWKRGLGVDGVSLQSQKVINRGLLPVALAPMELSNLCLPDFPYCCCLSEFLTHKKTTKNRAEEHNSRKEKIHQRESTVD